MKTKKLLFIFLIITVISVVSGCAKLELVYEFKDDGTIHEKHYLKHNNYDEFPISDVSYKSYAKNRKLEIIKKESNGGAYVFQAEASHKGESLDEALLQWSERLNSGDYKPFTSAKINRSSTFSKDMYQLDLTIDLSLLKDTSNFKEAGVPKLEYERIIQELDNIDYTLVIVMPYEVENTNADLTEDLDGAKKYTWNIKPKDMNKIELTFSKPNEENLIKYDELQKSTKDLKMIAIITGAATLIFTILFLLLRKKKGGEVNDD